eukprot:g19550.t1
MKIRKKETQLVLTRFVCQKSTNASEFAPLHVAGLMPNYPLEDTTELKKTQLDMAKDPYVLYAKPDPARVAAFLVGTNYGQLVKLQEKNNVGKGEPGQGWIVNDPETGKTIRCNSKQEFDLEDYLIAIVAKMKAEKEEKEQEKHFGAYA